MSPRHLIEQLLDFYSNTGAGESEKIFSLSDDLVTSLMRRSLSSAFSDVLNKDEVSELASSIESYDLQAHHSETPENSPLCRAIFDLFHSRSPGSNVTYEEFDRRFRLFIFTLNSALNQVAGPQLMDTPCREFCELDPDELSKMQVPEMLSSYMISLAKYLGVTGVITAYDADHMKELTGKMASAPGYLRSLSKEKKYQEIVWLFGLMKELQCPVVLPSSALDDMKASLALLLFNILPSERIASYLISIRPSSTNTALLYHYNAILALNYMLMEKYRLASAYAVRALRMTSDKCMKAYVSILQGYIALRQSDYDQAIDLLNDASSLAPAGRLSALIAFYRGIIFFEKREYANAIICFESAGACVTDPLDMVTVHNNIGSCAMCLGDMHRAAAEFLEMEKLACRLSSQLARKCKLAASSYIGAISRALGDNARALDHYENALKIAVSLKDGTAIANQMGNLGSVYVRAGDGAKALQYLNACMAYSERMGYREGIRFAYWHICHLLGENGYGSEARKFSEAYASRYPELKNLNL